MTLENATSSSAKLTLGPLALRRLLLAHDLIFPAKGVARTSATVDGEELQTRTQKVIAAIGAMDAQAQANLRSALDDIEGSAFPVHHEVIDMSGDPDEEYLLLDADEDEDSCRATLSAISDIRLMRTLGL